VISRVGTIGAAIIWCLLCSSCAIVNHTGDVFVPFSGMKFMFPMRNHEILDLGVSQLHNKSNDPIRVTGVKLVDVSKAVRQGRVDAFTYKQTQGGVYGEIGDLPARCPKVFVPLHQPYPVINAGRDARYYLTLQLRIRRPGAYKIHSARVSYVDLKTHASGVQVMDPNVLVRVEPGPARSFPQSECGS